MRAQQLDLFGAVEAAEQHQAGLDRHITGLVYAREVANTCIGYQLMSESASGWPNGKPAGADAWIDAAHDEMEAAGRGELVPMAPGACRACHHATIVHYLCQHACEAAGCDCRTLTNRVFEHLRVTVLPGGRLQVRTVADVMTERWAKYAEPWPGAEQAARDADQVIC
jgi:hypothetical protein